MIEGGRYVTIKSPHLYPPSGAASYHLFPSSGAASPYLCPPPGSASPHLDPSSPQEPPHQLTRLLSPTSPNPHRVVKVQVRFCVCVCVLCLCVLCTCCECVCVCVCNLLYGVNRYLSYSFFTCQLHCLEGAPLGNVTEGGSDTEIKYNNVTIKSMILGSPAGRLKKGEQHCAPMS